MSAAAADVPPRRVALVLPYNPLEERTGLHNLALRLANALAQHEVDARIVTIGRSGRCDGVPIEGARTFAGLVSNVLFGSNDVVHWLEVWPSRPHVHVQHLTSLAGRPRARHILTTETIGNLVNRGGGRLAAALYRRSYRGYLVSSNAYLPEYQSARVPMSRLQVVPHGLNPREQFAPVSPAEQVRLKRTLGLMPDLPVIAFIGRLVARKRPLDFVRAVAALLAERDDFQAVVVGDSRRHEDSIDDLVRREITDVGNRRLSWRPYTQRPWEYFALAAASVVSSDRDGQAFTILESMACGAVPIVSSLPIFRELVDGSPAAGVVYPVGDVDALVASLRTVLDDSDQLATLRTSGLARVRNRHDLSVICANRLLPAYGLTTPPGDGPPSVPYSDVAR